MEEKPLQLFICKDTGEQIHMEPVTPIEPWPALEPGGYVNSEPITLKHSGEFVFKASKTKLRKMRKLQLGKRKVPRKLKKAFKHIQLVTPIGIVEETKEHKFQIIATEYYKTRNSYPYTKWVRKAIRIATKERQEMLGRIMVSLEEHFESGKEKPYEHHSKTRIPLPIRGNGHAGDDKRDMVKPDNAR